MNSRKLPTLFSLLAGTNIFYLVLVHNRKMGLLLVGRDQLAIILLALLFPRLRPAVVARPYLGQRPRRVDLGSVLFIDITQRV